MVHERVGILLVEVSERVRKSVTSVSKKAQKGLIPMYIMGDYIYYKDSAFRAVKRDAKF